MKPTENEIKEFKKSIDEIHQLGNKCWSELEPLFYTKELEKKDHFSKEGQLTRDLGFVCNGILRIYYLNDKGEEWNKHFLQKNDFVTSSISPEKKSITNIQALTETTILCIP
ncbi:MAG: cyclic nucleotide-binding domain-containing protein, partial [Candidatus Cloacimonetes bacterium]|nr:cyclic nucleotide-binding domain-containing protein [Candidatus Cloacimonadota bacterium]